MPDEASASHDIEAPEVEFAEGWPAEVQHLVNTLFEVNIDAVEGRSRLGSLYFRTAPKIVPSIQSMVRDLAQEPWEELPSAITDGNLAAQLQALIDVLKQMFELSADHEGASSQKTSLEHQLNQTHDWFRGHVRPHAITARVNRVVEDLGAFLRDRDEGDVKDLEDRLSQVAELNEKVDRLERDLEARQDLISGLRGVAGESAGEELSGVFASRAQELRGIAMNWFRSLAIAVIAALIGAVLIFVLLRPEEGGRDAEDFAALGLGVFIIGLLVFAIRICAQNYRVNRHLEAVARSKAAALATFKRLVSSVEEQEIRSAVALALAQAVFATEDTGLIEGSGDHVTLVERALAPRIGGAPPA
jgi:hypothetical protein